MQTFNECFGVLGWLDWFHGTNTGPWRCMPLWRGPQSSTPCVVHGDCVAGFTTAMRLGGGTTLGVSRKEVASAVKASKAGAGK